MTEVVATVWSPGSGYLPVNANATTKSQVFIATAGQRVFTLTAFSYAPGTGSLRVWVNGVKQILNNDFTETSSSSFTVVDADGAQENDIIEAEGFVGITGDMLSSVDLTNFSDVTSSLGTDLIPLQHTGDSVLDKRITVSNFISTLPFIPAGAGAVATTVQAKLRKFINRGDYDTLVNAQTVAGTLLPVFDETTGNATIGGTLTSTGLLIASAGISYTGGTYAAGKIYKDATDGLVVSAIAGATYDLRLINGGGSNILTVATGTIAANFAGLATFNGGVTIASGQTLTLTGATVAGAPTWSSGQTFPTVTSTGALGVTGLATFNGGATIASGKQLTLTGATVVGLTSTGMSMSEITNSLGANVLLNNTANYFDGPSVAQGTSGKWFVSGTVVVRDTTLGVSLFTVKLWDGTTLIASTVIFTSDSFTSSSASLSGTISSPAGNIRMSVRDHTSTNGLIAFSDSGNSKDSTITAIRIG